MIFVEKVRKYSYTLSIEEAADRACRECIEEDVLKEILLAHRAEVIKMCITEFDERAYEKSYTDMIEELNAQHAEDIQELNALHAEEIGSRDKQISQQNKQISQLIARIKELESNQTIH